ncbi:alpha/beta fold hydrolase [Caldimonas tepidiphila]|uniref:alpha/beta fold hydrolase n=1 Tax=Caldimonas tepidiphila TaxID=2315841 RepID=UPI001300BC40|nr:alpha/beta fold hydrolase [Caldimonas tepidiphila]
MHAPLAPQRSGGQPPRIARGRLLRNALLAAGAIQLIRTARRELADFRACDAQLRTEWTTIPSPAGSGALRLHARLREDAHDGLRPVLLLHGWGIGSSYLVPLAARLGRHVRVYLPDQPGHGSSDHDLRPLAFPELADALAAWMDARGLRGAILVGHSTGCQVAAELALRRPELAAGLVLIGPAGDPAARSVPKWLARALAAVVFERPTCALWAAVDYRRAGARLLAEEMRQMVSHRIEDLLPRLGRPVRVVRGSRDLIVPQRWAARVARLAGAPAPTEVPGWGHAVHYDDPDAVAQIVFELALEMDGAAAAGGSARAGG